MRAHACNSALGRVKRKYESRQRRQIEPIPKIRAGEERGRGMGRGWEEEEGVSCEWRGVY